MTKKPQQTFILEIRLLKDRKIMRTLEALPYSNLYGLADDITQAFGFYFDHCFGYYNYLGERNNYHDSTKMYELFADLDREEGRTPENPGVEKVALNRLWKKPGDRWYFLFDYGDMWFFTITLKEIGIKRRGHIYPKLKTSEGDNPEHYPSREEPREEN